MGKLAKSESRSWLAMTSKDIDGGSLSVLSSITAAAFDGGVFHGTEIILTVFPSTDSVAEIDNSCACIGSFSPRSVMI